MAQLMPLPLTISCSSKIQIGFTSLVPAHPGRDKGPLNARTCVCVCVHAINVTVNDAVAAADGIMMTDQQDDMNDLNDNADVLNGDDVNNLINDDSDVASGHTVHPYC